jgi:RNA polymerase sigma-70 factor, ECF subfamily
MGQLGLADGSPKRQAWARREQDFSSWVAPHLPAMARLAARLAGTADRDDVVQDSLTRAWRRWETYCPDRGSPQAWLLAIVADRARRHRRRRVWMPVSVPALGPGVEMGAPDIDLERAVRKLPRRQRLSVELHYFVGLSTSETAAVMGCSEGTVKSNLHDARAHLRRDLEHP